MTNRTLGQTGSSNRSSAGWPKRRLKSRRSNPAWTYAGFKANPQQELTDFSQADIILLGFAGSGSSVVIIRIDERDMSSPAVPGPTGAQGVMA
jgi:hypothetical protein